MVRRLLGIKPFSIDLGLLVLRFAAGSFLMTHGFPKLMNYSERANSFSDPLGLGSEASLVLAILAEVFCSLLLILGVITRMALIPLIILMVVIPFIVHCDDPFGRKELPLFYLAAFLTIFLAGPGRYSVDAMRS